MKKHVFKRGGMRMVFESAHKAFNRQVSAICAGNQIGSTVYSSYVRPHNETKCNGFGPTYPPGLLQEFDLHSLLAELPEQVKRWVRKNGKDTTFIVYHLFHRQGERKITHGAIVTTAKHRYVTSWVLGPTWRSATVVAEAIKYVTEEGK